MDRFEECKFFAENMRHQAATQTYLSVNTVIFGVIAFLVKDTNFDESELLFALTPLLPVGILACIVWNKIIIQHKQLINWMYEQLMRIEKDLHQFYLKEWDEFFKSMQGKEKFRFSQLDKLLPMPFIVLYAFGIIGAITIAIF